jgi:hypothetical protein
MLVTAQQRLSYAKQFVERISSTHTIVVGGDKYDAEIVEVSRVKDYEFAKAWYGIAEAFYQQSEEDEFISSIDLFENEMNSLIDGTESVLSGRPDSGAEDIHRRLLAAVEQKEKGWYLGSLFDAASAYGLVLGDSFNSTDSNTLKEELLEKISLLRNEMNSSDKNFLWAEVYLDHSEYFLLSGDFYLENGYGAEAIESYRSGLSIALLAEQMFLASNKVQVFLQNNPELISSKSQAVYAPTKISEGKELEYYLSDKTMLTTIFLALILFLSFLVLFWEAFIHSKKHEDKKMRQIHHISDLLHSLDESHAKGLVKKDDYEKKRNEYRKHLNNLREKVKDVSIKEKHLHTKRIALIDSLKSRLNALKQHYSEGIIKKSKYEKEKDFLQERIKSIEEEVKNNEKH